MKRRLLSLLLLLAIACGKREAPPPIGDAAHGKQLVEQYGCNSCHILPGVAGPNGMVGPNLTGVASRPIIAGKIQNTPENMVRYLQNPQASNPANEMPNLGLSDADSRDLAAFLYTLK